MNWQQTAGRSVLAVWGIVLLAFLFLPMLSVFFTMSPEMLLAKLHTPIAYQALTLSIRSTFLSLLLIVLTGTPLAYWMSRTEFPGKKSLEVVLQLPIVSPPAVAGVGLLLVFGKMGWLGRTFDTMGWQVAFHTPAVLLAQIFIAAPFYLAAARQAFAAVDGQWIAVSRTLGVSPWRTFWRVTVPLALPGLLSGMALSFARALGEFGATMMFAGNLPGRTQTLPLAIYTAMQSDMNVAVAIAALLLFVAFCLLLAVGWIDWRVRRRRKSQTERVF